MSKTEVNETCRAIKWMRSLSALLSGKRSARDLEFVRTTEVHLIPRRLFEHVPDRVFEPDEIDRLYAFAPLNASAANKFLYLMVDKSSREIHGVLWVSLNLVAAELFVFLLSVDREYRSSDLPTIAAGFLFGQPFDWAQIKSSVTFSTSRPQVWEKLGCQRHPLTQVSMTKEWFDKLEREMQHLDDKS